MQGACLFWVGWLVGFSLNGWVFSFITCKVVSHVNRTIIENSVNNYME